LLFCASATNSVQGDITSLARDFLPRNFFLIPHTDQTELELDDRSVMLHWDAPNPGVQNEVCMGTARILYQRRRPDRIPIPRILHGVTSLCYATASAGERQGLWSASQSTDVVLVPLTFY